MLKKTKNIEKQLVFIGFCIFLKTPRPLYLFNECNWKHIYKSKSIKFKLTANRNKVQTWLKKYILKDKYNTPEFQQIRSQLFAIHRIDWPAQSFLALFAVYTSHPALMLASVNPSLRLSFTSHGHLDAILARLAASSGVRCVFKCLLAQLLFALGCPCDPPGHFWSLLALLRPRLWAQGRVRFHRKS